METSQANVWLSRFEPLLDEHPRNLAPEMADQKLALISELREEYLKLQFVSSKIDSVVFSTLHQAHEQLDSIESEIRQVQSTPKAKPVDVISLQARLAEREAKQELGIPLNELRHEALEMVTQRSNWAGAAGIGIFGLGWTSFTLIHSIFMIGGFKQAIGWWALGLLLFYGIFYFAGFAMLATAFQAASTQSIRLEGRRLTVRRVLGPIRLEKSYTIDRDTSALIGRPRNVTVSGNQKGVQSCVLLVDENGKEIQLCVGESEPTMLKTVEQINAVLSRS